jgi:hypothetical protein
VVLLLFSACIHLSSFISVTTFVLPVVFNPTSFISISVILFNGQVLVRHGFPVATLIYHVLFPWELRGHIFLNAGPRFTKFLLAGIVGHAGILG